MSHTIVRMKMASSQINTVWLNVPPKLEQDLLDERGHIKEDDDCAIL